MKTIIIMLILSVNASHAFAAPAQFNCFFTVRTKVISAAVTLYPSSDVTSPATKTEKTFDRFKASILTEEGRLSSVSIEDTKSGLVTTSGNYKGTTTAVQLNDNINDEFAFISCDNQLEE